MATYFILVFLIIATLPIFWAVLSNFDSPSARAIPFDDYKDQIEITDTKFHFGQGTVDDGRQHDAPLIVAIGKLKNDSQYGLSWVKIRFRCYDDSGELIDVTEENLRGTFSANCECPFRVCAERLYPEDQYDRFAIELVTASAVTFD